MQRVEGTHIYINIMNYDQIVADEEEKTGSVTHSIHALDTYFSMIERYGKKLYPKSFVVEKITGSRLHLYVKGDLSETYFAVKKVSAYAYKLSEYLNSDIPKYKTLLDFYIQVGCAFGLFYEYEFVKDEYVEATTIGHAANYAAKLQSKCAISNMSISEDIYERLPDNEKEIYQKKEDPAFHKYGHDCYYSALLSSLCSLCAITISDLTAAKDFANSTNLGDIQYSSVRQTINFADISKTRCKKLYGIPLFADIRNFTAQFSPDDENLEEMARKTQDVLESMFNVTANNDGVHVQFQGDRELSLYHETVGENGMVATRCYKKAVLSAMRLIDTVNGKPYHIHIGIGGAYGALYAIRIGARGEKDNILIGKTVILADDMEDNYADKDQIAITKEVYEGLKSEDTVLAKHFMPVGAAYVATIGYRRYVLELSYAQQKNNTAQNRYNGAWGELM